MAKVFAYGVQYSWANASITVQGEVLYGVTEIKFGQKQEIKHNWGAGSYAVGRGIGNIEATGSITLYAEELKKLIEIAPEGWLPNISPFDIPVTFFNESNQEMNFILRNAQIMNTDVDTKQGDTKVEVTLDLAISHIDFGQ